MISRLKKLNHETIFCEKGFNAIIVSVKELLRDIYVESFIDLATDTLYEAIVMDDEVLSIVRI